VSEELKRLIDNYGRACRRDGNPAWESEEGQVLAAALSAQAALSGAGDAAPPAAITRALRADPAYAWAWHCNLAMPIMDAIGVTPHQANKASAHLMRHLFDIDVTEFDEWKHRAGADEAESQPAPPEQEEERPCTCHPDDNPPTPCAQKYALSECRASAAPAQAEQQDTNPPFANCSFRICDLPGQCRGEGKCHHPKAEQQGDGAKHECICGDTKALNTVHRTDGPCYRAEQQGDGGAPVTDEQILEDAAEAFGRSREYSNCFAEPSERSLLHFVHKYMGQPSARVELSDVIAMALFDSANKHSFYTFMREAQNILAAHAAQTGESK
jgi:hypothetical protein